MARFATIINGQVDNVVEADQAWVDAHAPGAVQILDGVVAGPGWSWNGSVFIAPPPAPPKVPEQVTRRQAKRALLAAGKLDLIEPLINTLPEPQRTAAMVDWVDSNDFLRTNATLIMLATALGMSTADIDNLFIAAATY